MPSRGGWRFWWIATVLVLTSCGTPSEPLPPGVLFGTFLLQSLDERALPTPAPCGVFQVLQGSITLGPPRAASYTLTYAALGSGEELTYLGTGSFSTIGPRSC